MEKNSYDFTSVESLECHFAIGNLIGYAITQVTAPWGTLDVTWWHRRVSSFRRSSAQSCFASVWPRFSKFRPRQTPFWKWILFLRRKCFRLWADGEREGRRREGDHITQADCPEFLKTLFFMRSHLTTANKQWYIFKKLCSSVRLPRLVFRVQWRRQFCQARCPHHHYRLPTSNLILRLGEYNSTKNLLSWFCLLVTSMHVKAKKFGCKRSS